MIDDTFEKIVLMLFATPGMIAPAATATKPAIRAYSMRSCPSFFFHSRLSLRDTSATDVIADHIPLL
jgi:hypothetical protein